MEEIWKDIKGFEGRYQVSNMGRVRYPDQYMMRTYSNGNTASIMVRKAGILKPNTSRKYHRVYLFVSKDSPAISFMVHYLVAQYYIENYEDGMEVIHKDGDVSHNMVTNLECYWTDSIPGEI